MISVFSRDHRLHFGKYELIDGQFVTPFECPERMDRIMERIAKMKLGEIVEPRKFGLDPIARVHAQDFIDFMRTAHAGWKSVTVIPTRCLSAGLVEPSAKCRPWRSTAN